MKNLRQRKPVKPKGLSQKTTLCLRHEILFSFFNFHKKLKSSFLLKLKKENIFLLPWAKTVF